MPGKQHPRAPARCASSRTRTPDGVVTMFTMKGDPIKTLSRFKLPAGAQVAIISSEPESVREIKQVVRGHVERITEVIEREPTCTSRKLLVDKTAFEPDARSRALLEGVRNAEEDLRDAGGGAMTSKRFAC